MSHGGHVMISRGEGFQMIRISIHTSAFAFFICACFTLFAANTQARELLPKINNSDDFLEFIEHGILCKDQWAAANIFKGFGPNIYKSRVKDLKALGETARNYRFKAKFSFKNKCNFNLAVSPGDHNKILSMNFSMFNIAREEDDIYFLAILNAEKGVVIDKLKELGYERSINRSSYWGGEVFHSGSDTKADGQIIVKECDPEAKIGAVCRKPFVFLGCVSESKLRYGTCPWR
jgi:hypothetical protein